MGVFWKNGKPLGNKHPSPATTPVPSSPARASAAKAAPTPDPPPALTVRLAVVVTCHPAYLPLVHDSLASIDRQHDGEKTLVLDHCDVEPPPPGWKIIKGNWHNPNPARNAGWQTCIAPWVVFWDADDLMPTAFLKAVAEAITNGEPNLAIAYPVVTRGKTDPESRYVRSQRKPWSYWRQRGDTVIPTCSAWRRAALEMVGGWPEANRCADDHCLALRITSLGWTARLIEAPIVECSRHNLGHRSNVDDAALFDSLWPTRSLAIVTILIGRMHCFRDWVNWLTHADLPPRTALYIVDSSGGSEAVATALAAQAWPFQKVAVIRTRRKGADETLHRNHWQRSREVAEDYTAAFMAAREDLLLTLEDDTVPPLNAVRLLAENLRPHGKVAAAGGAYESARQPGRIAASLDKTAWRAPGVNELLRDQKLDAGWLPGGCTLFAQHAMQEILPFVTRQGMNEQSAWNWDNDFSQRLRAAGYKLVLDTRVWCGHNFVRPGDQVHNPSESV